MLIATADALNAVNIRLVYLSRLLIDWLATAENYRWTTWLNARTMRLNSRERAFCQMRAV